MASSSSFFQDLSSGTKGIMAIVSNLCSKPAADELVDVDAKNKSVHTTDSAVDDAVKKAEEKFALYWPRNIMILFGPPGELG